MKKSFWGFVLVLTLFTLGACSNEEAQPTVEPSKVMDQILAQVEQPALMPLEDEQVEEMYGFDLKKVEDYDIRMPMMNVQTNEIAIVRLKDTKDVKEIEQGMEKRAEVVQKQFETYLPDQYENAKNYQIVKEANYVLFVISAEADEIVKQFKEALKSE